MFSTSDTIVAIATPPGRGGIGVVRLSGSGARTVAAAMCDNVALEPRRATFVRVHGLEASDHAVVTWFQGPASYTGEDVVEISVHGSPVLLRGLVERAMALGARLAEPGEFTLRAYLHGRLDLVQAEAVRDLIEAVTPLQARAAFDQLEGTLTGRIREIDAALFELSARLEASLDFAGEGYHFIDPSALAGELRTLGERIGALLASARAGRLVREGAQVAIVGRPNAGKSTLFNALAGSERAIVTEIPGTTRDLVTEVVDIDGVPLTLIDTAGVRLSPADAVETEGIARARAAADRADLVLLVIDRSQPLSDDDRDLLSGVSATTHLVVGTKGDLPDAGWTGELTRPVVAVSAASGAGLDHLRHAMVAALGARDVLRDTPAITNVRHVQLLEGARDALDRAAGAADDGVPEEFVAADVLEARTHLEAITGARTAEDTLAAIFSRFCIGK